MKNQQTIKPLAAGLAALLAIVCLLLAAGSARAQTFGDLISNGDFSTGVGTGDIPDWDISQDLVILVGWGFTFSERTNLQPVNLFGDGPDNTGIRVPGDAEALNFGHGGGTTGGIYAAQTFGSGPGYTYTLTADIGHESWWLPRGEMRLTFLDLTNGVLSNIVVRTTDSLHNELNDPNQLPGTNAPTGTNLFDVGVPFKHYTNNAVSPAGTACVKVEFANWVDLGAGDDPQLGGGMWVDNVVLNGPVPPTIANVLPAPGTVNTPTNVLSFNVSSDADITNVVVLLNGVDVSGDLVITGPPTSLSVTYTNLLLNTAYDAFIYATDTNLLTSKLSWLIDTSDPLFTWEAEDYNYGSGLYINNPTPSDAPQAGSYFGLAGTEGVDFHDFSANGTTTYRTSDAMATELSTSEALRQKFIDAGASDYNVGWFDGPPGPDWGLFSDGIEGYDAGEWVNYTRDFPAGTYNIYGRLANGNGGVATIPMSRVTSDPTLPNQTTAELGVFSFPAVGWGSYASSPLVDEFGNLVEVTFTGTDTLRVTAGSGGNVNYFILAAPDTNRVTITDVYPDGSTLLQATNELTFTVSSGSSTIVQSNVVVTLNGADISGSLSFSGSSSSWNVSGPVQLGVTNYTAVISATDDAGNSHSVTVYFDTFDPAGFVVEGEDFDYGGGLFIDNPVITSNAAPDSYLDPPFTSMRDSVPLWDSYVGEPTPTNAYGLTRYRSTDTIKTAVNGDTPLQKLVDAQATNAWAFSYHAGWLLSNSWLNYTRTYPAGDFNVYARLATVLQGFSLPLEDVTGGTTNLLGNFEGNGRNFGLYDWIPLMDGGAMAKVTLGGVATLRFNTPQGEVDVNNFLFLPAVTLPEELQWSYAGGVVTLSWNDPAFKLQSQTNAPGAGISAGWSDYPGGATSPVNVSVDPSEGSVFYRLSD